MYYIVGEICGRCRHCGHGFRLQGVETAYKAKLRRKDVDYERLRKTLQDSVSRVSKEKRVRLHFYSDGDLQPWILIIAISFIGPRYRLGHTTEQHGRANATSTLRTVA